MFDRRLLLLLLLALLLAACGPVRRGDSRRGDGGNGSGMDDDDDVSTDDDDASGDDDDDGVFIPEFDATHSGEAAVELQLPDSYVDGGGQIQLELFGSGEATGFSMLLADGHTCAFAFEDVQVMGEEQGAARVMCNGPDFDWTGSGQGWFYSDGDYVGGEVEFDPPDGVYLYVSFSTYPAG